MSEERQRRRLLHNTLVELRGNIRVYCRVRPILPELDGDNSGAYQVGTYFIVYFFSLFLLFLISNFIIYYDAMILLVIID